jgi:hypothetical protein
VLLLTQYSLESSKAPVTPCPFGSVPSHDLPTFSASHLSPVNKFDAKCSFSQRHKATGSSSTVYQNSIGELLEGSRTEYRSRVYRHMMSCISKTDRAVALHMLRWVTYAARPLYTWELLDAVKLRTNIKLAESDIEKICGGLLRTTETRMVCLVHSSVQDYFGSQSEENASPGRSAVSITAHEMITKTCLQILDYEHLLKSPNTPTVFDLPIITMNSRWPNLYSYAQQHWRFHYINAERQSDCLPGILHEKLRNDWKQGGGILARKYDLWRTATGVESRESSVSSTVAFLNAALQEGARSGMVRLAKLELEMGASPSVPDSCGLTPLHYAAAAGNCEVVKLLIEYGGNANAVSNSGDTALSLAVANGRIEAVKLFLTPGSISASSYFGTRQNDNGQILPHATYQRLSLLVTLSNCCSNCNNVQSHFTVSTTVFLTQFKII